MRAPQRGSAEARHRGVPELSGAYAVSRPREFSWELRRTSEERAQQAKILRAFYALVEPDGWDARRLREVDLAAQKAVA